MRNTIVGLALLGLLMVGCQTAIICYESPETVIRAALNHQVREWNKGNLEGFMAVYARSEQIRFASGGDVSLGWQTVFDRYQKKYGTGTAMGTLNFSDLDITLLGENAALAFGRWHLKRGEEVSSGLFTLLFRETADGWRIVHDHTSAKPIE